MSRPAELYACLYAREFPAQALLRLRPEMQGKPCVVMEGEGLAQHVCSLNSRARLLRMAHGMTRVEVETFPAAVVLPRSRGAEAATKAILLECAGAFSPRIESRIESPLESRIEHPEDDGSDDTAFFCILDIVGTESLFGTPELLARSLLQRVKAIGIAARVTVSANFHAAVALARGLAANIPVQAIAPGEEARALAPLPLNVLDLTETQAEAFSLWGIHTLGRLAALPEKELIARMGQDGRRLRQAARGELPHLFQPVEPAFTLEERMELDSPLDLLESLLFGVGVMLDQLILRAQARILALASVTITLALDGGGVHTRTVRPALPSTDKQLWIKLLHLDLEAHPPQAAILAVTLHAEPGSTSKVQLGLFSPQIPEAARLDVTLARIRALVGEDCVGRAVLQDNHAPESFRLEPFNIPAPFSVPSGNSAVVAAPQPRACLRQLRPPEAVSVTLQNSRPAMFIFRERRFAVEHAYGPWLSGGNWWDQTLWGCEQWDLVARAQTRAQTRAQDGIEDGRLFCCCLMRDLMQNLWQMAALYD